MIDKSCTKCSFYNNKEDYCLFFTKERSELFVLGENNTHCTNYKEKGEGKVW